MFRFSVSLDERRWEREDSVSRQLVLERNVRVSSSFSCTEAGFHVQVFFFFLNKFIYIFIYFWLRWVFVAARGLSLVAVSRGCSSLWCVGFSLPWHLMLQSMGSRHRGFSSCGTRALERRLSSCGAWA